MYRLAIHKMTTAHCSMCLLKKVNLHPLNHNSYMFVPMNYTYVIIFSQSSHTSSVCVRVCMSVWLQLSVYVWAFSICVCICLYMSCMSAWEFYALCLQKCFCLCCLCLSLPLCVYWGLDCQAMSMGLAIDLNLATLNYSLPLTQST